MNKGDQPNGSKQPQRRSVKNPQPSSSARSASSPKPAANTANPQWKPVAAGTKKPATPSAKAATAKASAAKKPAAKKPAAKKPTAKKPAATGASSKAGATASKNKPDTKPGFWNYPRAGKGPIRRWIPSWRFILATGGLFILTGVGAFSYLYITTPIPEPEDVALAQSSTVYFADGETVMGSYAEINRQIIDTATLPEHVGQAIVASEDHRFYSNAGIDPKGIGRALWNNLKGNPRQGASTITQQYVERYYTGQTSGYMDKIEEMVLAIKIDQQQSKDEILSQYMNTIYFGRGAYGIEAAAQRYFGHGAAELSISESAMIAGVIPSPSRWDPAEDLDRATHQWNRALDYMVVNGNITQAERDAQVFPEVIDPERNNNYEGPNGYLLTMVRAELVNRAELTDAEIDTAGLKIVSTIDPHLQKQAVDAAQSIPDDHSPNLRVGLVSVDNETGAILSAYGGADYLDISRNAVTQDVAQGGSTFKIFTLVAALEAGIPLEQTFPSYSPMKFPDHNWEVSNFDLRGRGNINLVEATANSVNTTFAAINEEVGPEATVEVATRLGLPENTIGLEPTIANVLGTASPHPIDMAQAYSTIASEGVRHENFIVEEVTNPAGSLLYQGARDGEQVLDSQVAADATYAMTQVTERGTARTASQVGRAVAGKTGSSQNYRSAWFVGFVPQVTTAVAMYQVNPDGTEEIITPFGGVSPISGGSWPATIWTEYMTGAVAELPVEGFPERSAPVRPSRAPQPPAPAPTTEEPTTEEPTTEEPTTPEPTTPEPTTPAPTTPAPTTPEPTTPEPTTPAPTTPEPTTADPDPDEDEDDAGAGGG